MKKQRHTEAEIAAKLEQANDMSAQGELQGDIAKALGVSLMTYHRWRKAREASRRAAPHPVGEAHSTELQARREQVRRIGELQLENSRLRRLVTDLLLEKVALEESLHDRAASRRTAEKTSPR
jgi:putative transposase